ncbi:ComF family protein [Paenibacillus koleovorans]|uniref:ComF family protein n=1 Tax=Paenibacillus koleovorans TaxID=121608 RepID=UPI000FD861D6|nr:ComF family protein [Paenibacillus koleovorans]
MQCQTCGRADPCEDCGKRQHTYFAHSRSSVRYTAALKPWLARFKYRGDERLQTLFADMLELTFSQHYSNLSVDLITYVPISQERHEERGFNQAQLLAEELGRRLAIPVEPMLIRTRHTAKQSYKNRSARIEDMKQAFAIHPDTQKQLLTFRDFRPINIVIIDDVYTTGSTLNQCARIIGRHVPGRIYGLTWAR